MAITVKQDFVSSSKYSIKCPNSMSAKFITVHNTANDATAQSEINYMKNNNNQVSYHYAVDDKQVIQGIPENRNAWHTGDGSGAASGNRTSIGVEICYSKSGGAKYKAAEKLAAKFIAQLLHQKGWGIDRVKKHQDWSGKYCPHRILDDGRWNAYKQEIANELAVLKGGKAETIKVEKAPATSTKTTTTSSNAKGYVNGSAGQRVESIYKGSDQLNFYTEASFDKKYKAGTFGHGMGWDIVKRVKVGSAYMFEVKNSKGAKYYVTAASEYVKVEGKAKATTTAKKAPATSTSSSGIKSVGKIKIVGVSSAAIIMDKPDRNNSKNMGTIAKGKTISISGSVKGKNNANGYWEVIHGGKRRYISGQYGQKV